MGKMEGVRFTEKESGMLVCLSSKEIEVFGINDEETQKKKAKRRVKREKEKWVKWNASLEGFSEPPAHSAQDEFSSLYFFKCNSKMTCLDVSRGKEDKWKSVLVCQNDNKLLTYCLKQKKAKKVLSLSCGHHSDVRVVRINSEDTHMVTCSSNSLKLWDLASTQCLNTIPSGYGLCALFVPENQYVLVGTKEGDIEMFEFSSASCLERVKAHAGSVWSLALLPDGSGVVSGGADKSIKFWNFSTTHEPPLQQEDNPNSNPNPNYERLTIELSQSVEMSDDVLGVQFTPNGRLLGVSLLDSTIKLFFSDTLNFFLSLYGHKLPVLTFDISSDNTLLVSGSADKTIKVWGLDFGDCHKSMWAHDDSVMKVKFVPNTHYVFTASKDGTIKYWDCLNKAQKKKIFLQSQLFFFFSLKWTLTKGFALSRLTFRRYGLWMSLLKEISL